MLALKAGYATSALGDIIEVRTSTWGNVHECFKLPKTLFSPPWDRVYLALHGPREDYWNTIKATAYDETAIAGKITRVSPVGQGARGVE